MTIRVAVVDDYALVVAGVARLLEPFAGRVDVVELDANALPCEPVDVALYDTFAQGLFDEDLQTLMDDDCVGSVLVYTWNFDAALIRSARDRGLAGYVAKSVTGEQLADAIEAAATSGEFVISEPPSRRGRVESLRDWPGRDHGLSERESEVLALYTQGYGTAEAANIMYLNENTVKSHTKSLYRKLSVHTRTAAVLWGVEHGFRPDHFRQRYPGAS